MEKKDISTKLTAEEIIKWDRDLETIKSINELSRLLGGNFVLKGGLASEAYTNGRQKRGHGDIDATYYLSPGINFSQLSSKVKQVLTSEETNWEIYSPESTSKIEYRESDDSRGFLEKRRLELYVRETNSESYETGNYQVKSLISSKGDVVEVKVMEWAELVSMKIKNLYMAKNGIGEQGRPSNQTDYADLNMLLKAPEFNEQSLVLRLSKLLKSIPDKEEALKAAKEEYDFVVNLLNSL